jgi:UDP-N-acetylmuramoyl-L-alanyl-D-glutamate--2,6-diaminopimelate ligase
MEKTLRTIKKYIPKKIYRAIQPIYHYSLAFIGAVIYGFPSHHINVVFVTGTKGKSSTTEFINAILEAAGLKTALASTIRFKIDEQNKNNLYKMTIPGRFFLQRFLRQSVDAGCQYAIIEMTSEGARQFRHKFIALDALVFLNLSPEHIESHGSYENYVQAKLSLAKALETSPKKRRILIVNADDKEAQRFLAVPITEKYQFSLTDAQPYTLSDKGVSLTFQNKKIISPLVGEFTIYNILAAATYAITQNIPIDTIKRGIENINEIPGRLQRIHLPKKSTDQKNEDDAISIIVDYAHTPDSLEKLYRSFPHHYRIGVLGNTGGGRDTWKRAEMARIADRYCDSIILTDEDPYDDDPCKIVEEMASAIRTQREQSNKPLKIIMDRRGAIHAAIQEAVTQAGIVRAKIAVLISGKGTDPYIMRANAVREPWSDAQVAQEEFLKIETNRRE